VARVASLRRSSLIDVAMMPMLGSATAGGRPGRPEDVAEVVLADHVQERLRQDASLSGVQLDWDQVGSSLRTTSLRVSSSFSPSLARRLQGLGTLKSIPSRAGRRATDSNVVIGSQNNTLMTRPSLSFTAMMAGRDRRATEDNVLLSRVMSSTSPTLGPFSPSDDEEDRQSENLPIKRQLSASSSVSGLHFSTYSRSFSRRRRATESDAMPSLEPIRDGIRGPSEGPLGTISPRSPAPRLGAEEEGLRQSRSVWTVG